MTERPILYSGSMIRAILDGRKTQMRRVVPNRFGLCDECWFQSVPHNHSDLHDADGTPNVAAAVFGRDPYLRVGRCDHRNVVGMRERFRASVGDRLWARETWRYHDWTEDGLPWIRYAADDARRLCERIPDDWRERVCDAWAELSDPGNYAIDGAARDRKWRPSIFLPRWASRLTLDVTEVRVERLQAINEEDARAEGARRFDDLPSRHPYGHDPRWSLESPTSVDQCLGTARHAFGNLWDAINGKRAPWSSNPWVWVVGFRRVEVKP